MTRFLMLLFFFAPAVPAQGTLEVIPLRHRTVEQVLPVLRPLLEPGGAMSGQSYQLIVRTSPGNLAEIRAALQAIDHPARPGYTTRRRPALRSCRGLPAATFSSTSRRSRKISPVAAPCRASARRA